MIGLRQQLLSFVCKQNRHTPSLMKAKTFQRGIISRAHIPYEGKSLHPLYSPETLAFHIRIHDRHTTAISRLLTGEQIEADTLEGLIKETAHEADTAGLFNNASAVWNHNFFFRCLTPNGHPPSQSFINHINFAFGSFDNFKKTFLRHSAAVFGSGWTWLASVNGHLEIIPTSNSGSLIPLGEDLVTPLLILDLWEHAYMTQYGSDVEDYIQTWFQTVNWKVVEENLEEEIKKKSSLQYRLLNRERSTEQKETQKK